MTKTTTVMAANTNTKHTSQIAEGDRIRCYALGTGTFEVVGARTTGKGYVEITAVSLANHHNVMTLTMRGDIEIAEAA